MFPPIALFSLISAARRRHARTSRMPFSSESQAACSPTCSKSVISARPIIPAGAFEDAQHFRSTQPSAYPVGPRTQTTLVILPPTP